MTKFQKCGILTVEFVKSTFEKRVEARRGGNMKDFETVTATPEELKQTIAANITDLRKKNGLTQQDLANKLN